MTLPATSLQSEFATTLVDEWARAGIRDAVVSPGSRSSALALALLQESRIHVHMRLDERSGAFFAIGIALASSSPVVIVTTSGTATAELHAAVVEADLARVPLIVATADRPVELHHVGAPQTIDQAQLFAGSLRYFLDLPVAEVEGRGHWRSFGARLAAESMSSPRGPGPVHANIAFREPMVGPVGELPPGRSDGRVWHEVVREVGVFSSAKKRFLEVITGCERGVIVLGGNPLRAVDGVLALSEALGWPILGDTRAIRREERFGTIAHSDQFLRSDRVVDRLVPDCVVHVGTPHSSKTLMKWNERLARAGVPHLFLDPYGSFDDAERYGSHFFAVDPDSFGNDLASAIASPQADTSWRQIWRAIDRAAGQAIAGDLDGLVLTEPGIARCVFAELGSNDTLFCSSSMPIRDVEWFAATDASPPRVLANRGANGIDGVVSSVLGAATSGEGRTVGLIGDLALLHDLSGFVWGSKEEVPQATFVVIDNGGGGIFSFLSYPDLIDEPTFERGFGTPQRIDLLEISRGLGCHSLEVHSLSELRDGLALCADEPGISVIIARTDRSENVVVHQRLADAVCTSAEALL